MTVGRYAVSFISAFTFAAWLGAFASAQSTVPVEWYLMHVSVTDRQDRPMPGVEIRLDDTIVGMTDDGGQYYMARKPISGGIHSLFARFPGFGIESRTVRDLAQIVRNPKARGAELRFKLAPTPQVPQAVPIERGDGRQPNYDVVRIFYVTDRRDTGNPDPVLRYSGDRSRESDIARGICDVSIPTVHTVGELESPSWLRFEYSPDPAKHVVLRSVQPLESDPFYKVVAARVGSSPSKEAVVFIHGYNSSFEHAARQAAQIARDASFDGAPILYSWPSKNRLLAYTEDEDTIAWTAFHLRDFLAELAQRSHATKIHLIAHSMGNRALTSALQMIASSSQQPAPPFDQVVLAAPDIGADTLALSAREIGRSARRITLYASGNDDALLLSRFVHGATRAGQKADGSGGYLMVAPGIDTVDASAMRTDFLGHSYFAESGSIIDDIRKIFSNGTPPELRNLLPAVMRDIKYWIMPGSSASRAH